MIKQTDMCPDIDLRVPIGTLIDKYGSGGIDTSGIEIIPLPDPDIHMIRSVMGLSEQTVHKIIGLEKSKVEALNHIISSDRIEKILEFSERILFEKWEESSQ